MESSNLQSRLYLSIQLTSEHDCDDDFVVLERRVSDFPLYTLLRKKERAFNLIPVMIIGLGVNLKQRQIQM